jgi:hypothetical protein
MSYRAELPTPIPERILRLPVHRGYPVPWFVAWTDGDGSRAPEGIGTPDFRIMRGEAPAIAHTQGRCWVCGDSMGAFKAFLVGPMCAVNRISAEPPSHRECAEWSSRACPFLTRPHARRREAGRPEDAVSPAGKMIERNPGVALVWVTKSYKVVSDGKGGKLFSFGDPEETLWFAEGREATREEVVASIESGLPLLREHCYSPGDHKALDREVEKAMTLVPA